MPFIILRYINSKNRQGLTYRLAINHLADKTQSELRLRNGYRYSGEHPSAQVFDKTTVNAYSVPDTFDWRIHGSYYDLFI